MHHINSQQQTETQQRRGLALLYILNKGNNGSLIFIHARDRFYADWDWDKFIQHNMILYRCMISDIHDRSYVLFSTNLISNTNLHVGRPLLRPFLVAYAEATLARQKDSATNEKCWHHFRILNADKWSVVWNECKNHEFLFQAGKAFDPLQHD